MESGSNDLIMLRSCQSYHADALVTSLISQTNVLDVARSQLLARCERIAMPIAAENDQMLHVYADKERTKAQEGFMQKDLKAIADILERQAEGGYSLSRSYARYDDLLRTAFGLERRTEDVTCRFCYALSEHS
jgi:hypothetical protein